MADGYFDYRDGDTVCEAYAVLGTGSGRRPAVLVVHQWAGQTDAERGAARRLAALGYVGIAIDVYGKGRRGDPGGDHSALMAPFLEDRAALRGRLLAAVDAARTHEAVDPDRIAVIGYCFGGLCAIDVARANAAGVRGVVSLHGIFAPPGLGAQPPIGASLLVLHGWDDPLAPPADVLALAQELSAAGADWQLHAFGGAVHSFTNPAANAPERGIAYHAKADSRSWASVEAFLAEVLA